MNKFLAYVSQFGHLTPPQQAALAQPATHLTLHKGDYFAAQQVGFVEAGVLRICSYTEQGDELTQYFIEERQLLLNIRKPDCASTPSACLIQAIQLWDTRGMLYFSRF